MATISPGLSDNVISLTDVDFDDRVFGSSTHFVMFYGPWQVEGGMLIPSDLES